MLSYNVWIALKSLRRNPWMSTLVIGVIALGITISTSFITIYHLLSRNPLPDKSETLFYVRLDAWDPQHDYPGDRKGPPPQVTYKDVRGLMRSEIPARQTAGFESRLFVFPDPKIGRPFRATTRLVFSDFFEMFEAPFAYGGPWGKAADEQREQVVVLDNATNERLFGGKDSVGQTVRIAEREFRVAGVLARWRPTPRIYDPSHDTFEVPESLYIPFNLVEPMEVQTAGNTDGWGGDADGSFKSFLNSETIWLQFWVELPDAKARAAYADFLTAYAMEQKKAGRFQRPIDNRLTSIPAIMAEFEMVPAEARALAWISILFLTVCSLNLMGLLLGKFLARSAEVGVRRALGASRLSVFMQHIVECETVGVAGGLVGLILSVLVLGLFNRAIPDMPIFHLDTMMIGASILLALVAGLIAGLYPAWRICRIPPAAHLKIQ